MSDYPTSVMPSRPWHIVALMSKPLIKKVDMTGKSAIHKELSPFKYQCSSTQIGPALSNHTITGFGTDSRSAYANLMYRLKWVYTYFKIKDKNEVCD